MKRTRRAFAEVEAVLRARGLWDGLVAACERYAGTPAEVFSEATSAHVAAARHAFWLWMHEDMRWSYKEIGAISGHDHTTVRAGVIRLGRELGLAAFAGLAPKHRKAA